MSNSCSAQNTVDARSGVAFVRTPASVVLGGGLQKIRLVGPFHWWLVLTEARRVLAIATDCGCV